MAAGPFARIIAQFALVGGRAVVRAVVSAYKEAAQRGTVNQGAAASVIPMRRRMHLEEARTIFALPSSSPSANEIIERFEKLHGLNAEGEGGYRGSPYLQTKIEIAKEVLLDEIKSKEEAAAKPAEAEQCQQQAPEETSEPKQQQQPEPEQQPQEQRRRAGARRASSSS